MNISIIMDDNGNPIFSQEGTIDINTVIRDVLIDQDELKDVFTDKFKSLAESIKIDADKISSNITDSITDLFTFSSDSKDEIQESFGRKVKELLDKVTINKDAVADSIKDLFSYQGKDDQMKNIFDTINKAIPVTLGSGGVVGESTQTTTQTDSEASVFDEGATPVHLLSIEPSLMKLLGGESSRTTDTTDPKDSKGKSWMKQLASLLGLGGVLGFAGMKTGLMSQLTKLVKLPSAALKFATNPMTLLLAGVVWGVVDGIKATFKADEWDVNKISAALGGFLAGGDGVGGMVKNMGKWALMGAGIGIVGGPIGSLIGGLVGGILGAIFQAIGAETIAKAFDKLPEWASEKFGKYIDNIKETFGNVMDEFKSTWDDVTAWYNETLQPVIQTFKAEMKPVLERISGIISGFMEGASPVFGRVSDFVSNTLWPAIEGIGKFFGELLVDTLKLLPTFIDESINGIKVMVEDFKTSLGVVREKLEKAFDFMFKGFEFMRDIVEKIGQRFSKMKLFKSEEEKLDIERSRQLAESKELTQKTLEREETLHKQKLELAKLEEEVGEKVGFWEKRRLNSAKRAIQNSEKAIEELNQAESETQTKLKGIDRQKKVMQGADQKGKTIKVQDMATSSEGIQVQLDSKDSLETYGDQSLYSKEGGTLDNAINKVADKLETQLNEMAMFKEMFKDYMKYVSAYNTQMLEMIPPLASGNNEPMIPAEQAVPQGYIRDPNFEYRMRMREVLK